MQERASIKGKSLQQLGDWQQPLSLQHEVRALLCVAASACCHACICCVRLRVSQRMQCPPVLLLSLRQALVAKALVGLATVLYKSFPTSIQHDSALLAQLEQQQQQLAGDTDARLAAERARLAVQYRLGNKRLLERATRRLLLRLQQLASDAAAAGGSGAAAR